MRGGASDSHGCGTSGGWGRCDNEPPIVPGAMPPFPPGGLKAHEALGREGRNHQTHHSPKRVRALTEEARGHSTDQTFAGERYEAGGVKQRRLRRTEESTPAPAGLLPRKPSSGDPKLAGTNSGSTKALHRKVSLLLKRSHMQGIREHAWVMERLQAEIVSVLGTNFCVLSFCCVNIVGYGNFRWTV
jgi:hypothetical protein